MKTTGKNEALARRMLAYMEEKRDGKGGGVSAAIIRDGQVIAACASGVLDGADASVGDLYNVGSVSKVYTAAAVMKLCEMGLVDLDRPVADYLPRFRMRDARYRDITLRMTLCHTSGLPGSCYRIMFLEEWRELDLFGGFYESWENGVLKADPGAYAVYCNEAFELAAAVIEEVSGMSFNRFLQTHITRPAGAVSANMGACLDGEVMMHAAGKKPEFITALGAGAVRTTLADCARFGTIFLDPGTVLSRESVAETARPHGVTFLKKDAFTPDYGLGWDSVRFSHPLYDLGENVLAKGGATGQFGSQLIVLPGYGISAAISRTGDCPGDHVGMLCEFIAMALEESGVDIRRTTAPKAESAPLSREERARYAGIYYGMGIYKAEIEENRLRMLSLAGSDTWEPYPLFPEMTWDGECFACDSTRVSFEEYNGVMYVYFYIMQADIPLGQKVPGGFRVDGGWRSRIGKRYVSCDQSTYGSMIEMNFVLTVGQSDQGVLLFTSDKNDYAPFGGFYALAAGDDDTRMLCDAPGMGARDQTAPFVYVEGGTEYMRIGPALYRALDSLPLLREGAVAIEGDRKNTCLRIPQGARPVFDKPEDVDVILLDEGGGLIYSSRGGKPMPEAEGGYLILLSDRPTQVKISLAR